MCKGKGQTKGSKERDMLKGQRKETGFKFKVKGQTKGLMERDRLKVQRKETD